MQQKFTAGAVSASRPKAKDQGLNPPWRGIFAGCVNFAWQCALVLVEDWCSRCMLHRRGSGGDRLPRVVINGGGVRAHESRS
jgi:hypothetical protein